MAFQFDEKDDAIRAERLAEREKLGDRPNIGDYVLFPTGELERFSHDWGDGLQTAPGGSFHLQRSGQAEFGGGLNPITPLDQLALTDKRLPGSYWFFHHGQIGAERAVYFTMPCRVFSTTAKYEGYLGKDFQSSDIPALKALLGVS